MAGAGAGSGRYTVRPFFANGHGEQCIIEDPKGRIAEARVDYVLPEGVHFVTVQQAGSSTLIDSSVALRTMFGRGFDGTVMVPKPPFDKESNRDGWCRSDYMRFKHEIAKMVDAVYAYTLSHPGKGDLFDFTISKFATDVADKDRLSFDELIRRQSESEKNYFDNLCDLYDKRIHIRYPGQTIADNNFTAVSYMMDEDKFAGIDGGAGLFDGSKWAALDRAAQSPLMKQYDIQQLNNKLTENPSFLADMYAASVFPTREEVAAFLSSEKTQQEIRVIMKGNKVTRAEAELDVLSKEYTKPLSVLIPEIVAKYGVNADNPIVIYYPLCRVFPRKPQRSREEKAIRRTKALSLREETTPYSPAGAGAGELPGGPMRRPRGTMPALLEYQGLLPANPKPIPETKPGGRRHRRTYRKKKLRTQTRKRRQ